MDLKIAICDDEQQMIDEIRTVVDASLTGADVCTYPGGTQFLADAERCFDVILLDIDMPGMSGMEVAAELTKKTPDTLIVFVTAHDELVYDSFRYHPFAFVRKSYLKDELMRVLRDCIKVLEGRERYCCFKAEGGTVRLALGDIFYFEADANYISVHAGPEAHKFRSTMAAVEASLSKDDFLRIHKGFIVNMGHIRTCRQDEVTLDNGETLPIGKAYAEAARQNILKYMRRMI